MSKKNQQAKEKKAQQTAENTSANSNSENQQEAKNNQEKEQQEENDLKVEVEDIEKEEEPAQDEEQQATDEKEEKIKELENQASQWQDKYLRLSAEFDNFRKRTAKEKSELTKTAGEDTIIDILPVMDDFERAMESLDNSQDVQALKDGVHLIYGKFRDFLNQKGVKEIEAKEKDFDTDLHDAITKVPAPSEELKGKIVDVVQKGYTLHDKVIRYAKVVIGE
ncbi:MAG: nucleotide exchange factor GrpE [Bacteroidetes bacterium]|nr:nucleotide exchange factor GrpE [Bacteroidota bacterium]